MASSFDVGFIHDAILDPSSSSDPTSTNSVEEVWGDLGARRFETIYTTKWMEINMYRQYNRYLDATNE